MNEVGLIWLGVLILGIIIAFPVYVLVRLADLGGAVRELRREMARLREARAGPRPAPQAPGAVAPEMAPPADSVREVHFPPVVPAERLLPAEPVQAAAHAAPRPGFELSRLESLLGANWMSKLGIAALILATAFFLKYAFEHEWIGPSARVAIGVVAAAILLGLGQVLLGKPEYRAYAQVLSSGGIVILFLSIYAAYNFYHLLPFAAAFGVLALAALAASALAVANDTQTVAVICIVGAFATPVLIRSGGEGAGDLVRLYAYLAGLNVWSTILVRYRAWHGLTLVSFAGTWLLFFGAGPLHGESFLATEAFAAVFLAFACYGGMATARPRAAEPGAAPDEEPEAERLGVLLVLGGCVFFAIASALILSGVVSLGLPALAMVGILMGLLMAVLALAFPADTQQQRIFRSIFRYLAAAALVLLVGISVGTSEPVRRESAAAAFAFGLFSYLVFLAVAVKMSGEAEQEGPAAVLVAANGVTQAMVAFHALGAVRILGINAAPLWLPLAGCIGMCALWAAKRDGGSRYLAPAAAVTGQVMNLLALFGALALFGGGGWPATDGVVLFGAEFLVVSLVWVAARRLLRAPAFRADLVGAFGNAAVFFGLLATAARLESYQGLVLLAGCAVAMAAYHALVGGSVLSGEEEDPLHRFTYLRIALMFVTVAIPLQLKASYITLAWAVESAVLVWTGLSVGNLRVRQAAFALLAVTAAKALFVDIMTDPQPFRLLLNERMLAGASVVAAAYVAGWLLWKGRDALTEAERVTPAVLALGASIYTMVFVSLDLWEYVGVAWRDTGRGSAQQLALSLFWSAYALGGLSVGIWKRTRPIRLFAIGLLYVSILKAFLFDLSFLEMPFRIVSFFVLGLVLLLVSLMYTRFEGRLK